MEEIKQQLLEKMTRSKKSRTYFIMLSFIKKLLKIITYSHCARLDTIQKW